MSIREPFRNPAFALLFTVVVALSLGCVASGLLWPESESNSIVVVSYGDMPAKHIGERVGYVMTPQVVRIRRGMPPNQQRRVVVHELYHAAGWENHNASDPACYSYPSQRDVPCGLPCPEETAEIRRVTRTLSVRVQDQALLEDVRFAVRLWNRAAGREVFVLSE